MTTRNLNRRDFLRLSTAAAVTGGVWSQLEARASTSVNAKLNIACIGTANRAGANIQGVQDENIVAMCDVDKVYLDRALERFPEARGYADYRRR